ncbi:DinB family protein [Algoriphagus ratkowskyi]|uniref:DinB family protein n=1 Tax=Algoriphagus ratkowskyi TaxID=57028 RepID=A0A2W7R405_9BACT|nr:DinB family protein [Algoriphagus ratkowskyi]PZX53936.1 DinB family protein [Algoriphagus ratkowskyi]TXD76664.1 DinB family protein [Algoriphagus ratkowskyi]
MKILDQPKEGDYSTFFSTYLNLVSGNKYEEQILKQADSLLGLFHKKGLEWASTAYEEGKWTPKEVLGHVIDTERIMTFRALCFARGEKSALPGFDQDPYVLNARFGEMQLHYLLDDLMAQRIALLSMIRTLPEDTLDLVGTASGNPITPRALFWIIPGHFAHHMKILEERY